MIDLYAFGTSNGYKASIMLEEVGLPYQFVPVNLAAGEHRQADFLALNPLGMIPVIVDNDGAGGEPVTVFETQAICYYLADKTGQLIPDDAAERAQMHAWIAATTTDFTPAFAGQFRLGLLDGDNKQAIDFHESQASKLLGVLDARLAANDYLAGSSYSIADVLLYPMIAISAERLSGGCAGHASICAWRDKVSERAAVQRGMAAIPSAYAKPAED